MGNIPTYVGNTILKLMMEVVIWDHPYVCGEYQKI